MEIRDVQTCLQDWEDLKKEYTTFETLNKEYVEKLAVVGDLQAKCLKEYNHQVYRLGLINKSILKLKKDKKNASDPAVDELFKNVLKRFDQLRDIEQTLPKSSNSLYLKIILGNVNVSILNKSDKFRYKDEYEKFKLVLSGIGLVLSVLNLTVMWRPLELAFMFLLVWYYCTLTIRESILKVNGSRIKGWWRLHHFISTFAAGVLLIWPNTKPWYIFRGQFMWFNCYVTFVQYLQFRYQQGVLYRLKALGERHNMDITIEGFHSWMWRGLSFLLPFLFAGYIFQLYNAITLYRLSFYAEATWQVPVLCATFFILFLGNTVTTCMVIPQKFSKKLTAYTKAASDADSVKRRLRLSLILFTPAEFWQAGVEAFGKFCIRPDDLKTLPIKDLYLLVKNTEIMGRGDNLKSNKFIQQIIKTDQSS